MQNSLSWLYMLLRCWHTFCKANTHTFMAWYSCSLTKLSECNYLVSSQGGIQLVFPPSITQSSKVQRHAHATSGRSCCSFISPCLCPGKTCSSQDPFFFSVAHKCQNATVHVKHVWMHNIDNQCYNADIQILCTATRFLRVSDIIRKSWGLVPIW